jgi:hypothetical protein
VPAHHRTTGHSTAEVALGDPPVPSRSRYAGEVAGEVVRVYTWVDLADPDTGLDPGDIGELVARLHTVRVRDDVPVHPWFEARIGEREWKGRGDAVHELRLYDAYVAAGGPGRVRVRQDLALAVAELHHIGHRHLTMWLAAKDPEARARSLAGIEEFLGQPLLMDDVDRLVAAVSSAGGWASRLSAVVVRRRRRPDRRRPRGSPR